MPEGQPAGKEFVEFYAYVAREADGQENFVMFGRDERVQPLMTPDIEDVENMTRLAQDIADATGHGMRLVKFKMDAVLGEVIPDPDSPLKGSMFRGNSEELKNLFSGEVAGSPSEVVGPIMEALRRKIAERAAGGALPEGFPRMGGEDLSGDEDLGDIGGSDDTLGVPPEFTPPSEVADWQADMVRRILGGDRT